MYILSAFFQPQLLRQVISEIFKMLCTTFLHALLLAFLTSAVAVAPVKRQVGGINIIFSASCNSTSRQDITDALTNAIDMAFGIKGIDTKTDIGAFECEYPHTSFARCTSILVPRANEYSLRSHDEHRRHG
jgi:hypothetical protein